MSTEIKISKKNKGPESISDEQVANLGEEIGYFKLNLPKDKTSYDNGNGEGVWAVVTNQELKDKIEEDEVCTFYAYNSNDSIYYPGIVGGTRIHCECIPGHRPIAILNELQDLHKKITDK